MNRADYLFDPTRLADRSLLRPLTGPGAFKATVSRFRDRLALVDGATRLTWGELEAQTEAFAAALQARGIEKGDVVALHVPNSWQFVVAYVGIGLAGAVTLTQHMPYREAELRTYLGYAGAKAIVGYPEATQRLVSLRNDVRDLQTIITTGEAASGALAFDELLAQFAGRTPNAVPIEADDPFALYCTSGTESLRPKVCINTHAFLSNSRAVALLAGVSEHDVILTLSGFTHAFGIAAISFATVFGAALVCLSKYDPGAFLDLIEREGVTMAWAVPAQLSDSARVQRERGRGPFPTLREVRTGGTPITNGLADDVRAYLCPNLIVQYGMSEIACALLTRYNDPPQAALTLGKPLQHGEIRIVDGELWYRSPYVFRGYYRDPETTAATVTQDGWVRTGDLASLDADGRVVYEGRSKDIINRGGMKVSAFELEGLVGMLPAIRQLAIVCVEDERLGDRACVTCSLHAGATLELDQITAHLAAHGVAKYKWPELLLVLDELPTTPTGKVAKGAVRALVAARKVSA